MKTPKICVSIVNNDLDAIKEIEPVVDLLEVRIDLIGNGWQEIARHLEKPWIACNRLVQEGGSWQGTETERIDEFIFMVKGTKLIVKKEFKIRNQEFEKEEKLKILGHSINNFYGNFTLEGPIAEAVTIDFVYHIKYKCKVINLPVFDINKFYSLKALIEEKK